MQVAEESDSKTVGELVSQWDNRNIAADDEYQRGSKWKARQKQMLIDSVFRGYPLPRFYFRAKEEKDFYGTTTIKLDVVDGQQRLIALSEYVKGKWALFSMTDASVALPTSVKQASAPWQGLRFDEFTDALQRRLLDTKLSVVVVKDAQSDEIRDLFIRLQAGTPLTAQQVRDAWPGTLGPYIERLAGKTTTRGAYLELLSSVDKRGSKSGQDEDDRADDYEDLRQTCAQLFLQFQEVRGDKQSGSLAGRALNGLYHENSDFDPKGQLAIDYESMLGECQKIISLTAPVKRKHRKIVLFSLARFIQDLAKRNIPIRHLQADIADRVANPKASEPLGLRPTGGSARDQHYRWFRDVNMGDLAAIPKDPKRLFDEGQKAAIYERDNGKCRVCGGEVRPGSGEYDHTHPWSLGGQTVVDNGRLVHRACHTRGAAALVEVKRDFPS